MNYTIAIFGTTIKESWEFLMSMVNEIPYGKVKMVCMHNHTVELHDRTKYIAVTCSDYFRGIKFHKVYISRDIPKEDYWPVYRGFCPWNDIEEDDRIELY